MCKQNQALHSCRGSSLYFTQRFRTYGSATLVERNVSQAAQQLNHSRSCIHAAALALPHAWSGGLNAPWSREWLTRLAFEVWDAVHSDSKPQHKHSDLVCQGRACSAAHMCNGSVLPSSLIQGPADAFLPSHTSAMIPHWNAAANCLSVTTGHCHRGHQVARLQDLGSGGT